ncbi:RIP metalloprotease RseP [Candidatus Margulisiibacteriota bacterium]
MISTVITLLALGLVIFIHELGHLLAAKYSGVGVYEFSIGMGPKLISRKYNDTEYSLRLFPIGGFVKLVGMDDQDNEQIDPEKDFHNKPLLNRFITISAGAIMNIIVGTLIFSLIAFLIGVATPTNEIKSILAESPAAKAGLKVSDRLFYKNSSEVSYIISAINQSASKPIALTIERGNSSFQVSITPKLDKDRKKGMIGIVFQIFNKKVNPLEAMAIGLKLSTFYIKNVFITLSQLVRGGINFKHMAGPIGIIQMASAFLQQGLANFLNIMAIISVSLGIINLLPFPVLDGGHLLFLGIEFFRKKRLPEKTETVINNTGAAILIFLMSLIVLNDILNWKERMILLKNITGL